jgi:alkanesulfonate monooxygenase SsuD/methylene tetrahydromethanopterin reductase-like flavin-dependent oxidoreductase (luciferase family)
MTAATPFGSGSVAVGLHPVHGLDGAAQAQAIVEQARAAELAGFDGVTLSEHHGGFPGYMGQPLLACTWILAATERIWSGPAPYVLGFRNPLLVAEALAWTAARFPGRVGAALASGYTKSDFDLVGADFANRGERFGAALATLRVTLAGETDAVADPAIAQWARDPAPLLRAANSTVAVRRAAAGGFGVYFPGGETRDRLRGLIDAYRAAGGPGPVIKIRTLWMGAPPPGALEERDRLYREAAAAAGIRQSNGFAEPFVHGSDKRILEAVARDFAELDIDGINLRFHLDGVDHRMVLEQLHRFGGQVLPELDRVRHASAATGQRRP